MDDLFLWTLWNRVSRPGQVIVQRPVSKYSVQRKMEGIGDPNS